MVPRSELADTKAAGVHGSVLEQILFSAGAGCYALTWTLYFPAGRYVLFVMLAFYFWLVPIHPCSFAAGAQEELLLRQFPLFVSLALRIDRTNNPNLPRGHVQQSDDTRGIDELKSKPWLHKWTGIPRWECRGNRPGYQSQREIRHYISEPPCHGEKKREPKQMQRTRLVYHGSFAPCPFRRCELSRLREVRVRSAPPSRF